MYYHLSWYSDGCVEILSMDELDLDFVALYEKCIRCNNRIILNGKLIESQDVKNKVIINTEKDIVEHLTYLNEDDVSDDYQLLKDYHNKHKGG